MESLSTRLRHDLTLAGTSYRTSPLASARPASCVKGDYNAYFGYQDTHSEDRGSRRKSRQESMTSVLEDKSGLGYAYTPDGARFETPFRYRVANSSGSAWVTVGSSGANNRRILYMGHEQRGEVKDKRASFYEGFYEGAMARGKKLSPDENRWRKKIIDKKAREIEEYQRSKRGNRDPEMLERAAQQVRAGAKNLIATRSFESGRRIRPLGDVDQLPPSMESRRYPRVMTQQRAWEGFFIIKDEQIKGIFRDVSPIGTTVFISAALAGLLQQQKHTHGRFGARGRHSRASRAANSTHYTISRDSTWCSSREAKPPDSVEESSDKATYEAQKQVRANALRLI